MNLRHTDYVGKKYGFLTVVKDLPPILISANGDKIRPVKTVECICDCGRTTPIRLHNLVSGHTKSCGCYHKRAMAGYKQKHGLSRTVEYSAWCKMKDRCYNPNIKDYKRYGARCIKVCERWLYSFESFLEDMGLRPSPNHSLERKETNGDYCPDNCIWATRKEQSRNKVRSIKVEYNGSIKLLIEVCEEVGANYSIVRHRINGGWDLLSAITAPKRTKYTTLLKGSKK